MIKHLPKRLKHLSQFVLIAFIVVSCSKKETDGPIIASQANELVSITIKRSDNPTMKDEAYVFRNAQEVSITLPMETNLQAVKAEFVVSPKAKVSINNQTLINNTGTLDLSGIVAFKVTSEAGSSQTYTIMGKQGRKELDKLVYEFKAKYNIPGISLALSKTQGSKVLYRSGIGYSDKESQVRVQPNHLFRLGSMSKQFTSICIMKLIQQGNFNINKKVFGPDGILAEFSATSEMSRRVTVKHLLEHTSGWTSDPDPLFTSSFRGQTLDQRINHMLISTQKEPGTVHSYYNMGFATLGKIIEKVSGKKFEVFLKEVLSEANITDIHVGGNQTQRRLNEAIYYSQDGANGYLNEMEVIAAAGGLIASTDELLKLLTHIDGLPNVPDILTPEIRTMMFTPSSVTNRYALGWRMNHTLYGSSPYHGGNLAGTATMWVVGDINCVVLCNSRSYILGFDDATYVLLRDLIATASGLSWD